MSSVGSTAGAVRALVANLDNPADMKLLVDGCETLEQRLARVDRTLVSPPFKWPRSSWKDALNPTKFCGNGSVCA